MSRSLFACLLPVFLAVAALCGDTIDASITGASLIETNGQTLIDIGLSASIADDDSLALQNARSALIRVFDVTDGSAISNIAVAGASGGTLAISVPAVPQGHVVSIVILGLTFGGKQAKKPLTAVVSAAGPSQKDREQRSSPGPFRPGKWTEAKGKDDANVYLATQLNGAVDTDPTYNIDAKLDVPFRSFHLGKRVQNSGLQFSSQISNAPKADPDSMKFGGYWRTFVWDCGSRCSTRAWFRRLQWINQFQSESNKDFSNTNIVWPTTLKLISKTWGSSTEFGIRPYVGNELGYNINSPLKQLENRLIDRPLIGMTTLMVVPLEIGILKKLNWQTSYERRWPLRSELVLQENKDGSLKSVDFGTSPRDHVKTSVNAGFGPYFGLGFSYEYGQLPPSFKLVDHAFRVDVTVSAKRKGSE